MHSLECFLPRQSKWTANGSNCNKKPHPFCVITLHRVEVMVTTLGPLPSPPSVGMGEMRRKGGLRGVCAARFVDCFGSGCNGRRHKSAVSGFAESCKFHALAS